MGNRGQALSYWQFLVLGLFVGLAGGSFSNREATTLAPPGSHRQPEMPPSVRPLGPGGGGSSLRARRFSSRELTTLPTAISTNRT